MERLHGSDPPCRPSVLTKEGPVFNLIRYCSPRSSDGKPLLERRASEHCNRG